MVDPGFTFVEELLLEVLDERPVLALDIPLALRPVWDAVALLYAKH